MTEALHDATGADPAGDLTLRDAAALYAVSARTLAQHIRCGQLPAYRTSGAAGREWRVTREALVGYPPRQPPNAAEDPEPPLVAALRRELTAARRAAAAERRRAEDADRRLGHAMLECGRLRAALAAVSREQDTSTAVDLTSGEARELVNALTGTSTAQRLPQEDG